VWVGWEKGDLQTVERLLSQGVGPDEESGEPNPMQRRDGREWPRETV